jgi:hypothetical protein
MRRLLEMIVDARQRQVNREIANYLNAIEYKDQSYDHILAKVNEGDIASIGEDS